MPQSLRAIATGGHIAVVGMVAAGGEGVNPTSLIATGAKLQGLMVGSRDSFEAMCRAIDKSRIRPVVDKVYPWTEARAAFEAMRDGAHFGKIVLKKPQITGSKPPSRSSASISAASSGVVLVVSMWTSGFSGGS